MNSWVINGSICEGEHENEEKVEEEQEDEEVEEEENCNCNNYAEYDTKHNTEILFCSLCCATNRPCLLYVLPSVTAISMQMPSSFFSPERKFPDRPSLQLPASRARRGTKKKKLVLPRPPRTPHRSESAAASSLSEIKRLPFGGHNEFTVLSYYRVDLNT